MGYFSWLTADTEESISIGSERPVYLLQPNGLKPIKEEVYGGFGVFGGMDVYLWLAEENFSAREIEEFTAGVESDEEKMDVLRSMAISRLSFNHIEIVDSDISYFNDEITENGLKYDSPRDELDGKTINELLLSGKAIRAEVEPKFPIKLSYDKTAVYERLEASADCPHQGYFYPEVEEEEENDDYGY